MCRHCRSLRRQYQIPVQGRFACKVSGRNLGGDGSVEKGRTRAKKETACSNMRMPLPPRFPAAQGVLPPSSLSPRPQGNGSIRVVDSKNARRGSSESHPSRAAKNRPLKSVAHMLYNSPKHADVTKKHKKSKDKKKTITTILNNNAYKNERQKKKNTGQCFVKSSRWPQNLEDRNGGKKEGKRRNAMTTSNGGKADESITRMTRTVPIEQRPE